MTQRQVLGLCFLNRIMEFRMRMKIKTKRDAPLKRACFFKFFHLRDRQNLECFCLGIGVRKEVKHMLFSHSVLSDSLWPHGLQHTRPPCPSPSPEACSNSHPLGRWCHPTISSSAVPFPSCLQSFPAPGPFLMSRLFPRWPKYWSLSFSISPSNEYSGRSRVFSNTTVQKHQFFGAHPPLCSNSHIRAWLPVRCSTMSMCGEEVWCSHVLLGARLWCTKSCISSEDQGPPLSY